MANGLSGHSHIMDLDNGEEEKDALVEEPQVRCWSSGSPCRSHNGENFDEWCQRKEMEQWLKEQMIIDTKLEMLWQMEDDPQLHQAEDSELIRSPKLTNEEKHNKVKKWMKQKKKEAVKKKQEKWHKKKMDKIREITKKEVAQRGYKEWLKKSIIKAK